MWAVKLYMPPESNQLIQIAIKYRVYEENIFILLPANIVNTRKSHVLLGLGHTSRPNNAYPLGEALYGYPVIFHNGT